MPFDPVLADIRFGTGLSPSIPPPGGVAQMIARLAGADSIVVRIPLPSGTAVTPSYADLLARARARRAAGGTDAEEAAVLAVRDGQRAARLTLWHGLRGTLARGVATDDGLRERLVTFWADHFTVQGRNALTRHLVTPFVEDAIRPHVAGRFADMLRAVVLHPMMILYLDQNRSVGPGSRAGLRTGNGLNENLARELLELYTLGVGAPYTQTDVRELAELLTGLTWGPATGAEYRANYAEPGAETVLGQTFSAEAEIGTVAAALDALAGHPATARHIARKIAAHFVADDPDTDLVDAMADAFARSDGLLTDVISAMLGHPAAWASQRAKIRQPFDFVRAALRALAMPVEDILALDDRLLRRDILAPMAAMGQAWQRADGPDGWPEEAAAWITPQGMAARITWAFAVPARLIGDLPDPRAFVLTALGADADPAAVFAAAASEDRADGIGVVLASAAFQRR